MYFVSTMRQCKRYLAKLKAEGYTVWGTQFGTYSSEGFHIQFWKSGQPLIELYTHDAEIEAEMNRYSQK